MLFDGDGLKQGLDVARNWVDGVTAGLVLEVSLFGILLANWPRTVEQV